MSMMSRLSKGGQVQYPIVTIYGQPGVGKTTLAAQAPKPIFIETERGLTSPSLAHVDTFGLLHTYEDVLDALKAIYEHNKQQGWKTIVLDSLDRLNPLIEAYVCKMNGWKVLEDGAYGKGKNALRDEWRMFLTGVIAMRDQLNMGVIMLGHNTKVKVSSPDMDPYDQYTLTMDEKVRNLIVADSDIVGFATYPNNQIKRDEGFGRKTARLVADKAILICKTNGAQIAKNRYQMPDAIDMSWEALARYVPAWASSVAAAAE